ncbi:MAG: transketolase [Deltaproteobacteria bacterium]|nr:transketolase [Deltaproteobacteria bacterium]
MKKIDELCVNTIRFLSIDAVEKARSGHPGMPMGDAVMAYVLWTRFLRHNPLNPLWQGRDRFVLSAGHGSMLLYSLLHLTGYDLTLDDIRNFRQWGSHAPGHPEYDPKRGVEVTTGPLGQGFAVGVGMAMAERYLRERYNRPGYLLFDYHIYGITSDGDMMEGISNEAASLAGHLGLGNIIYLYSDNRITIEGGTDLSFTEDVGKRFEAMGWHVQKADGNDIEAVSSAIEAVKKEKVKPSLVIVKTNIGFGSPNKQDNADAHGAPLGADEVRFTKERLGWPLEPSFHVPDEALRNFRTACGKGKALENEWDLLFEGYSKEYPKEAAEIKAVSSGGFSDDWIEKLPRFGEDEGPMATRSASGKALNAIAPYTSFLVGGSADLAPSNNTYLKGFDDFTPLHAGRNIHFGVREHAMGAIANGMALSGLVPYIGTFLVFSDYMRPAIRLSAMMGIHVIYVFTHDSIGLGEDGPTHQPIEHLAALRAIPNLIVIRPADMDETVEAWKTALLHRHGPVALVLTRQNVPRIKRKGMTAEGLKRGAYIVADAEDNSPDMIIMASGSEVSLAVSAYERLSEQGIKTRVVSMPCWEFFEKQDTAYKESVLPSEVRLRISIEAGATFGWARYTGREGVAIGIDRFGASAPCSAIFERLGLTTDAVVAKALALFDKQKV